MFWRNLKLWEAVPSNWRKPRPKFDVTDAKFEFEFPEDLGILKDKEGTRKSWAIEKLTTLTFCCKNNHPHICHCHAVPSNWRKPRPKFDFTDAKFEFEFPEDLGILKDKEGTRKSWAIEKLTTLTFCCKNNHPHICHCHAVPSNWRKPRPKFDFTDAKFEFEFPEDLGTLKDK